MKKLMICLAVMLMSLTSVAWSQTPEERGLEIAKEIDKRNDGFVNSAYEANMKLKNRQGDESTRHFFLKSLEVPNDGDKEVGSFDSPPDIKGTIILTFSHGLEPDDQWMFLPELKRVKRISSVNKSGPFVGSEFTFEDIASWQISKYTYKYLRDDVVDGNDCFVVEFTPAYEYSGYSKLIWWIDKNMYEARKIEYFDRKDELMKTLLLTDYHQYLERYWRPNSLFMENHQSGKSTTLLRNSYVFKTSISASDFTENALKNSN
jgi:outer membrane lipoprotein-sorting protein